MREEYEATKLKQRIKTEVVTREVQKIIDRPVYFNACFILTGYLRLTVLSPTIPVNLNESCLDLEPLDSVQAGAVLLWVVYAVVKYKDCQARHASLVDAIK